MIGTFRMSIGHMDLGQWFRYGTGLIEFTSAFALLIPALAGIGALLLVPTMIAAVLTQLLIIGGNPALPIGLLIIASIVAWGRIGTTLELIGAIDVKRTREATRRSRF
jgi:putative oxidoreductase